jgi:hypothetical protein
MLQRLHRCAACGVETLCAPAGVTWGDPGEKAVQGTEKQLRHLCPGREARTGRPVMSNSILKNLDGPLGQMSAH